MNESSQPMARDVVAIGASAGGLPLLRQFLQHLSPQLPACVVIAIHRHATESDFLREVLTHGSTLPIREPHDGESLEHGVVFVAPRDHHLTVRGGAFHLQRSAKVHHARPAIDPLFESLADACGRRTVGVVLTGNLSDGVAGLVAIKRAGGLTMAQDPNEAEYPSIPWHAIVYDHVDVVFCAAALGEIIQRLAGGQTVEQAVEGLQARAISGTERAFV
jgi:two-component system chemotaxis response regulator CheB